ncbi:hypothetical protein CCMSSC00406_0007098 [Pleurotus cornucopiae]|uniref:Uncharacterized protein n=1 Tax=Pleurotus cornucopiae TaxID=5321 RepID=A0ACB7J3U2_PLECO|nr:hypothetical protein CCMSSC00406_0007098 [Pleurotus cornucopiae]
MVKSLSPSPANTVSYVVHWCGGSGDVVERVCVIVARLWKVMGSHGTSILQGSGSRPVKAISVQAERTSLVVLSAKVKGEWQFVACTGKIKDAVPGVQDEKEIWVALENCEAHSEADRANVRLDMREVVDMPSLTTVTVL